MVVYRAVLLLAFITACAILNVSEVEGNPIGDCWATWSRCTRWSSWFSGKLWQNCDTRCKCLGRSGGNCVEMPSKCPLSSKAWQCQCYGSYNNPTKCWCGL